MPRLDPVISRELVLIRKLIEDEAFAESERRGCPVSSKDPKVREAVCAAILRLGAEMRRTCAEAA